MQDSKQNLFTAAFNTLKQHYAAFLLSVCINLAIVGIYGSKVFSVASLCIVLGTTALYMMFDLCKKKGITGTAILAIMQFMFYFSALLLLLSQKVNEASFTDWFFTAQTGGTETVKYTIAVLLTLGTFIASSVFYFSENFKLSILVLICFIPGALYVKLYTDFPVAYTFIFLTLIALMYIESRRSNVTEMNGIAPLRTTAIIFAAVCVMLTDIIPKSTETKYNYILEDFFNWSKLSYDVQEHMGMYSNTAGEAAMRNSFTGQILYYVEADEPIYLRTAVFDIYANGQWMRALHPDNSQWQIAENHMVYSELRQAYIEACKLDPGIKETYKQYGLDKIKEFSSPQTKTATVSANRFRSQLIPVPLKLRNINMLVPDDTVLRRTYEGEIESADIALTYEERYPDKLFLPSNHSYRFEYAKEVTQTDAEWLRAASQMPQDEYQNMLLSMRVALLDGRSLDYYSTDRSMYLACVADAFRDESTRAASNAFYYNDKTECPPEIKALAEEITADKNTDYEKARALADYFLNNGFVYNLDYEYPKGTRTPYNFIFKTKTGVCTDFATSMTIMARSVGLSARYVEGFVAAEPTNDGRYVVRDDDAHTFVEVYISGLGWTTFDPTVPTYEEYKSGGIAQAVVKFILDRSDVVLIILGFLMLIYIFWLYAFRRLPSHCTGWE